MFKIHDILTFLNEIYPCLVSYKYNIVSHNPCTWAKFLNILPKIVEQNGPTERHTPGHNSGKPTVVWSVSGPPPGAPTMPFIKAQEVFNKPWSYWSVSELSTPPREVFRVVSLEPISICLCFPQHCSVFTTQVHLLRLPYKVQDTQLNWIWGKQRMFFLCPMKYKTSLGVLYFYVLNLAIRTVKLCLTTLPTLI